MRKATRCAAFPPLASVCSSALTLTTATTACARSVGNLIHNLLNRKLTSSSQGSQQVCVIFLYMLLDIAQILDSLAGMHHRGVIATAKGIADLRQAVAGEFLRQRHCHLARPRHRTATALGQKVRDPHLVIVGYGLLDVLDRDQPRLR